MSASTVEIFIDFKSIASYLCVKPTLVAAAAGGFNLVWQPFSTRVKELPDVREDETKGETHIRVRETARRAIHQRYARGQGIELEFPDKFGATELALAGLHWLTQHSPDAVERYIDACFTRYWHTHPDLNDLSTVQQLLEASGAATVAFAAETAIAEFERWQDQSVERGVIDAPAYFVADQMFIGREHLPWITQLARGH